MTDTTGAGTTRVTVPAPPLFDPRRTRRAVWRGIARTALVAVVWLWVATTVLQVASGVWSGRGRERFDTVVRQGFAVAHPEFGSQGGGCCNSDRRFGATLFIEAVPRTARANESAREVRIRRDARGRIAVQAPGVAHEASAAPVTLALSSGRPEATATRRLLAQLPRPVTVTAVVELAVPSDQGTFDPTTFGAPIFVTPMYDGDPVVRGQPSPAVPWPPLSWPEPSLAGFQRWATGLRPHDDPNLAELGLPDSATIQRLAGAARIHGFVAERVSVDQLRRLLNDPAVRSVSLADVAFDLDPSHLDS